MQATNMTKAVLAILGLIMKRPWGELFIRKGCFNLGVN